MLRRPKRRRPWKFLLLIVALLVLARLALPYVIEQQVESRVAAAGKYTVTIGDIDMNLWRGAYEVENVRVMKTSGDVPVPFFSADKMDFSIEWSKVFSGQLVGEVSLKHPVLNYVQAPKAEDEQIEPPKDWDERVQEMFPFRIDRVGIENGEVHYRRFRGGAPYDLEFKSLHGSLHNLTSRKSLAGTLPARLDLSGDALEKGKVRLQAKIDPYAKRPTFELDAKLTDIDLVGAGEFLRAATNLDIEGGVFDADVDLHATNGKLRGTVRSFFENVKVIRWLEDEEEPSPLSGLLGRLQEEANQRLLGNQQDYAAKIPISTTIPEGQGVVEAVATELRNALVRGLMSGLNKALQERMGTSG